MSRRSARLLALTLLIAFAAGCSDSTAPTSPVTNAAVQKEKMKNEDGTPMKNK